MNEQVFQEVFDLIGDFLPQDWTKTVLFAGYTKGSYSIKYYCQTKGKDFTDCFDLGAASKAELIKLFIDIDKVLSKERESLDEKNRWSVLTMMVDHDGSMRTAFDYDDHSEDMIAYEKEWKERYLYTD